MKSSTFFRLLVAVTARECFAGILVETKKFDGTSILKAAVSTLPFNFFGIPYFFKKFEHFYLHNDILNIF